MADIFKEVDEDLRRDQAGKLWQKYRWAVIGAAVLLVAGTASFQIWTWWDKERRTAASERYAAALQAENEADPAAALARLGELAKEGGGYATLAAFNAASLHQEAGERAQAIAIWDRLAADKSIGSAFSQAALLLSVMHQVDDGDPAALAARLAPLLAAPGGYRPVALELDAALALRQGDRAKAKANYTEIADNPNAPADLRARAAQVLATLEE